MGSVDLLIYSMSMVMILVVSVDVTTYEDINSDREIVINQLLKRSPTFKRSHFSPLQPKGSQVVNVTDEEAMLETSVFVQFTVTRIENVDAETQTMTFTAIGIIVWQDKSLSWNKTNGLYGFEVDKKVVWTPELLEANVLASDTLLDKVILNYTGILVRFTQKTYTIPCSVHILEFPFDSHVCQLDISAPFVWLRRIKLVMFPDGALLEFVHSLEHLQWKLTGLRRSIDQDITYSLQIEVQRKATFFTIVLLLPCIFLNTMSIAVFLLPPAEGGRADFAVNVMVSHYIFLLIMMDSLPPAGGTLPLLGIYILGSNGIVVFVILTSLLMVKLAAYGDSQRELPSMLASLCRGSTKGSRRRSNKNFQNQGDRINKDVDDKNVQMNGGNELDKNKAAVDMCIGMINRITIIFTLTSHTILIVTTVVYWAMHRHVSAQ